MKHYIGIAGTNAKHSTNRQLIQYMSHHYADSATITLADIAGWPLFYKTPDHTVPAAATTLAGQIQAADGVIIATPEYDHAVPAVLSSALAWLSYYIHPFAGKPVMILGASYGALGTSRAQAQLRQILTSPELDARILPSGEFLLGHSLKAFTDQGELTDAKAVAHLDELMANFAIFADINAQLTNSLRAIHKGAQA
ncbi:NADPH-dependent FMN reductase [Lacticaseibacillus nasuensis]|uniref:NADPH-dependent FMN reductase n=1 Tax=Lacticaseibacillus nasuensis TaxID=944671 RepID=UPI0022465F6E|nr:NADPH-dependent FMN reductase [Lacticaseibacillus nasuensis]MCX2455475.1 NAD(P)H-dependent oxidoreductase [Lacticaseibacillus nasuensis]